MHVSRRRTRPAYAVPPEREPDGGRHQQAPGPGEPRRDVDALLRHRHVAGQITERVLQLDGALGPVVLPSGDLGDGSQALLIDDQRTAPPATTAPAATATAPAATAPAATAGPPSRLLARAGHPGAGGCGAETDGEDPDTADSGGLGGRCRLDALSVRAV